MEWMVDNIIYQIKRYLCITNKRESYGVQHHFQQYFSYIVAVGFICGGNQQRKLETQILHL
jgi:hypothetical protein